MYLAKLRAREKAISIAKTIRQMGIGWKRAKRIVDSFRENASFWVKKYYSKKYKYGACPVNNKK